MSLIDYYSLKECIRKNKNYKRLSEILYVFYSGKELGWPYISKIGVQKSIYLSEVLAPLKKVILSFLNFIYHKRGPYSADIQNSLDYLVSLGAIEVVKFKKRGKSAFVDYRISESGESVVHSLLIEPEEKEKCNWVKLVLRVIDAYKDAFGIGKKFEDMDKIVDLVYEEPSFKEVQKKGRGKFIQMTLKDNLTMELTDFLKNIEETELSKFLKKEPKRDFETILLMFFEHLYLDFLSKREKKDG